MAILNWAGKDKVIGHHRDIKYRTLERIYSFDENGEYTEDINSENMIIHGDNLEALKSLLPKYQGKIKCIYIDPPYNTGEEKWIYNDNVNDPRIRKWLGQVVGKEGEDLSRHDKWLCMMYPRLKLLEKLLSQDGAIFISIGDDEFASLKLICDEIFGIRNFISMFVWKSRAKPSNTGVAKVNPQNDAEYILCYGKGSTTAFRLVTSGKDRSYPHQDKDGNYRLQTILKSNRGENKRETMTFELNGYKPPATKRWQAGEETIKDLYNRNRITFQTGEPMLKYYEHEENEETAPFYCFVDREDSSTAENGKKLLNNILGNQHDFDTVKPVDIINYLLTHIIGTDDIILDSFAGSGTTAHAVLNMNKADGGNRKFILIEMMDYAESITAERVKRVIQGYDASFTEEETLYEKKLTLKNIISAEEFIKEAEEVIEENRDKYSKIGKVKLQDDCIRVVAKNEYKGHVDGIGGNFSYYELGPELFNEDSLINPDITEEQLREYVYYTETRGAVLAENEQKDNKYYLGSNGNSAYYLYFEHDRTTTLNHEFLATIKNKAENYIVYADKCVIDSESLIRNNITFKKIPRDVIRF